MPKSIKCPKELTSISDHLRKRRLDLKLSHIAVSRILGVTEDTITFWEKDRIVPQISALPGIIKFLGYSPNPIDTSTLGGKIKEFRYLNGLSKSRIAKHLNVDPSTITTWEANQFKPIGNNYRRLIDYLKVMSSLYLYNKRCVE